MNIKDFSALLKAKDAELNDFRHRKLPVLVGRTAKDHFQENFRQGGFVDGSLHPWQEALDHIVISRKKEGKKAGKELPPNMVRYFPAEITCSAPSNIFRETPASP